METQIGCSVVIYDKSQRVLIAQRGRYKKQCPLLWETVGGAIESGETPEECIRREAMEEIGCTLLALKLFKVYVIEEAAVRYVLIVFTAMINEPLRLNYEIENTAWVNRAELDEYDFYVPSCKQKLIDFFQYSHSTGIGTM